MQTPTEPTISPVTTDHTPNEKGDTNQTEESHPWLAIRGLYADIPDDIYAAYLKCIDELRAERDRADAEAESGQARFTILKATVKNVGGNDLRIAATALEMNATVVTRNVRDFERVPGLTVENWAKPENADP